MKALRPISCSHLQNQEYNLNNKIKISVVFIISIIAAAAIAISFPQIEKAIFNIASKQFDRKNYKAAFFFTI